MEETLLVLETPQAGDRIEIHLPGKIFGRADFSGSLAPEVSRRHAQVYYQGGHWRVRDLESTNGTTVNGCLVEDCLLAWGDRIGFGGVECLVTTNDDQEALTARAKELLVSLFDRSRREKAQGIPQNRAA